MSAPEYAIEFRRALDAGRVIGVATCGACDWQAMLTDDHQDDVDRFLSKLLVAHALAAHHARVNDTDTPPRAS